ncbi:hypothetical protein BD310DRAFT_939301 [Dichomitus squalens]|uniref:Uncharacterized protein n=1 Tax=Dichomitus squalens TaxID=114155 RepID=A0A4Q9PH42_9APHY|nr:hypothetical protein BD310DRAFT_939301 [Dichomitus squalens]
MTRGTASVLLSQFFLDLQAASRCSLKLELGTDDPLRFSISTDALRSMLSLSFAEPIVGPMGDAYIESYTDPGARGRLLQLSGPHERPECMNTDWQT